MSNHKTTTKGQTRVLPLMVLDQPVSGNLMLAIFSGKTVTIEDSEAPENAFVVDVPDDSLEPRFAKGTHLVAVKREPHSGAMVLVYSHEERKVSVCYYFKERGQPMLVSLIEKAPTSNSQDDIIGVVVEARYHFKSDE